MEKIKYSEFIKNIKENDISQILVNNMDLQLEMATVTSILEKLSNLDIISNSLDSIVAHYMKKNIVFFEIVKNYTILDISEQDSIENYNIELEEKLKANVYIKRVYSTISDVIETNNIKIISEFKIALENLPSAQETNEVLGNFEKIFSTGNQENLNILKEIVAYNDPTLKTLKEVVYDDTEKLVNKK